MKNKSHIQPNIFQTFTLLIWSVVQTSGTSQNLRNNLMFTFFFTEAKILRICWHCELKWKLCQFTGVWHVFTKFFFLKICLKYTGDFSDYITSITTFFWLINKIWYFFRFLWGEEGREKYFSWISQYSYKNFFPNAQLWTLIFTNSSLTCST